VTDVSPTGYNVTMNSNIIVTFNEPVNLSTVNDLGLTVTTDSGYTPVDGRIYSSGALTQVVLEPDALLKQDTRYRGIVPSPGIRNVAGENIEEAYIWRFTTGNTVDASGTAQVVWQDPGITVAETPLGTTTILRVTHQDDKIISDGSVLVPTGSVELNLEFNAPPSGDLTWASGFVSFESQDVLGWDIRGNHIGLIFHLDQDPVSESNTLKILAPSGGIGLLDNTEYTIRVHAGIQASGYNEMPDDYVVSFTTTYYPIYSTSTLVRMMAGPFIENIPDDTVRRSLLHSSRRATKENGGTIWGPVPVYVTDYVTCQAAADSIRQEYSARAGSSGQKHLGDLTIDIDVKDISGLMDDTLKRLQQCADEAWGLIQTGGRRVKPVRVVRGEFSGEPQPGLQWSRILDWGGEIRWTKHGPNAPGWLTNSNVRWGVYAAILGDNPMPSHIHYGEFTYALSNNPQS
jgi:hypothetical protein